MKLRDDQMDKLAGQIKRGRGGFWDDPGVGKTPPACVFMYWLWAKQKTRTVWAMPSHLMDKNRRELLAWSDFSEADIVIVDGTRSEKDDFIASNAKVFITTFPGLVAKRDKVTAEWQKFREAHADFDCVVLDEPHKYFSNNDSSSTQELYRCMRVVKYFLAMTGTVIKGRLDSAYPLLQIIEPKYYGNYQDFLTQHTIKDLYGNVLGWRNHEKLTRVLEATGSRTSFESVYGERKIVYFIEEVDMSPAQRKTYDEFEVMGMAELDTAYLEGSNEGVNLLRLRQILAHPERINLPLTRDGNGKILTFREASVDKAQTSRDEAILAHLEDHKRTGEPVVVVSTLIAEQERLTKLCRKVGLETALINSNVSNETRFKIDRDFQAGKIQCVVGSPSTMGTGFNWSHLDHIIFAGLDFSADDFIQMLMRAFRGARTKPLRATLIQYRDSVEQQIDGVLDRKSRESYQVDNSYLLLNLDPRHRVLAENVFYN